MDGRESQCPLYQCINWGCHRDSRSLFPPPHRRHMQQGHRHPQRRNGRRRRRRGLLMVGGGSAQWPSSTRQRTEGTPSCTCSTVWPIWAEQAIVSWLTTVPLSGPQRVRTCNYPDACIIFSVAPLGTRGHNNTHIPRYEAIHLADQSVLTSKLL